MSNVPRGIDVATPQPCPATTRVKQVRKSAEPAQADDPRCHDWVICARGMAVQGIHPITEVKGKIYKVGDAVPQDPPADAVAGQWVGQGWYFDGQHANEISYPGTVATGDRMVLAVWVTYANGVRELKTVTFCIGTVGDKTECDSRLAG